MPANMLVQLASDSVNSVADVLQQNCVMSVLLRVLLAEFL
jgi:hypothetical protein